MLKINVTDKIYWLGTNDRRKQLFENMWPLPNGVAYNSYLINDVKTALVDTIEMGTGGDYVGWVEQLLEGRELNYLIVNHMEPDHAGEIGEVLRRWPALKVVGNNKTLEILEAYYGVKPGSEQTLLVKDGDTLELGHHTLRFILTPWVHWPETMMTYDATEGTLFTGDAFGSFGTLDGAIFDDECPDFDTAYLEEMRRYYSNIVGKYSNMVQKAYAKIAEAGICIKRICPTHGLVWRSHHERVLGLYDRWSRYEAEKGVVIAYASMYGNGARTADYIARRLVEQGVGKVKVHDVSKTHVSYLINDLWRYKGVILGSCAYNTCMHPMMEQLTTEISHLGLKDRFLGIFGSYSWNGGGARSLKAWADAYTPNNNWELVAEPADIRATPTPEKMATADALATAMAAKLK